MYDWDWFHKKLMKTVECVVIISMIIIVWKLCNG